MDDLYVEPKELKKLRACTTCKLLKTERQWKDNTCENCGILKKEQSITANFKGFVCYTDPNHSWVAKWLTKPGIDLKPGVYCISVEGDEDYDNDEYEQEDDIEEN